VSNEIQIDYLFIYLRADNSLVAGYEESTSTMGSIQDTKARINKKKVQKAKHCNEFN
jgi:hypothetical protein